MTKLEIEDLIKSDQYDEIAKEIIGLAMYEEDYEFSLKMVISCSYHTNEIVRGNGVLCLGHLARVHRKLPKESTISILNNALKDDSDYVRGQAFSAIDDIELFVPDIAKKIKV